MPNCNDINKNETIQRMTEFMDDLAVEEGFNQENGYEQYDGKLGKFKNKILNHFKGQRQISEKDRKWAAKRFVKAGEREQTLLALEIDTLLRNHMHLNESFNDRAIEHIITKGVKVEWTESATRPIPKYDTVPVPDLRIFHHDLIDQINGGKMFKEDGGFIGNMQYEYMNVRAQSRLDPTGLMHSVNKETEKFQINAQGLANKWILSNQRISVKDKQADALGSSKFGIGSIINDLNTWVVNQETKTGLRKDSAWKLFSEIMKGRVNITKNGNVVRYQKYAKIKGKWTYLEPGQFMHTDINGKRVALESIDKTPTAEGGKSDFVMLGESIGQLRFMLNEMGLEGEEAVAATTKKWAFLKNKAKRAKLDKYMAERIEDLVDIDSDIGGLNIARRKTGKYYPDMFLMDMVPAMFQKNINKQERTLQAKQSALELEKDPAKRKQLFKDILNHQASISFVQQKIDFALDPDQEYYQNMPVRTSVWYQNFKEVSNIFAEYDMARTTEDVPLDYANELAHALQRNKSVISVYESVLNAKLNGATDLEIDRAVQVFNTTFYNKNAHSQIFGVDLTAENIASKYGGNPETIRNFSKGYNSWTTFSLLWGMFQGLTNKSAAFLKRDIAGNEAVHRAQAELKGPRRQKWAERIERAGVHTLSSFVDTYFAKNLRPEEKAAAKKAIQRFKGLIKQQEALTAEVGGNVNKNKMKQNINQIKIWQKAIKKLKGNIRRSRLDSMAQWAIRRGNNIVEDGSFIKTVFSGAMNLYNLLPSINETELQLRSESYVLGVQQAVKYGYAPHEEHPRAIDMGFSFAAISDFALSQSGVGAALRGPIAGALNKMRIWHSQKTGYEIKTERDFAKSMTPYKTTKEGNLDTREIPRRLVVNGKVLMNYAKFLPGMMAAPYTMGLSLMSTDAYGLLAKKVFSGGKSQPLKAIRDVNPAAAQSLGGNIRMGLLVGFFEAWLFAPGAIYGLSKVFNKASFMKSPAIRGVSGAGSLTLSAMYLAYSMLNVLFTGEGEEDLDLYISKWSRKFGGVGWNQIIELILVAGQVTGAVDRFPDKGDKKHFERLMAPIITGPGAKAIDELIPDFDLRSL
tara:strand:+ start:13251 stop:16505 length:3255 start_codon:yes stop_codon:yes gene_type:complete